MLFSALRAAKFRAVLSECPVFLSALPALVGVPLRIAMRPEMAPVFVQPSVIGVRDALKVREIVVERIVVFVVDEMPVRHWAVELLPDRDVERDLLAVAVLPPAPKIDSTMPLLGIRVSVVLPSIEFDRLGTFIAPIKSPPDCL